MFHRGSRLTDVFSKAKRSEIMSSVRSSGNRSTELKMIALFKDLGIMGWRRNWPLIGHPDFVFPKSRVSLFVDGCFWHACPIHCQLPASNAPFWQKKLKANARRDREVNRQLEELGWLVIRIWEHEIKEDLDGVAGRIFEYTTRIS